MNKESALGSRLQSAFEVLGKTLMQLVTAEVCLWIYGICAFVHLYDHRVGPLVPSDKVCFTKGCHKVHKQRGFVILLSMRLVDQKHFSIGFQFCS